MSINKKALIRYYALDRCLSNPGRKFFIDNLLEYVNEALADEGINEGIKRRQLFDDLNFMQLNWSAPIERYTEGKKKYYRYEDLKFSINNHPLNQDEINKLKEAFAVISKFKGMPQFSWVEEILTKINYGFTNHNDQQQIISFDNNEYLLGIDFIGSLFDAIVYKKVLEIEYCSYKSNIPLNITIHPYFLKQYNNRWFLFGYNESLNKINNLALDRIQNLKEIKHIYKNDNIPDFNEYFEDIIGVTKPEGVKLEKINIRVSPYRTPYVKSKPIHGSQKKVKEDETGFCFTIEIIPNNEFYQQVLSFGADMEILEPKNIRGFIKNEINKSLKNYK